jgi:hypothetical protein
MHLVPSYRLAMLGVTALLGACSSLNPGSAIQSASASTSQTLCSGVFVSGRDADQTYREEMRPTAGMGWVDWALRYRVDTERREVQTTIGSVFASRSVYRDGMGCLLDHGNMPMEPAPAREAVPVLLPEIAGPAVVVAQNARLRAAVDEAFDEPEAPPWRYT